MNVIFKDDTVTLENGTGQTWTFPTDDDGQGRDYRIVTRDVEGCLGVILHFDHRCRITEVSIPIQKKEEEL